MTTVKLRRMAFRWIATLAVVSFATAFAYAGTDFEDLLAGAERSISLVESNSASAWETTLVFEEAGQHEVAFRTVFQVENPADFVSLSLETPPDIKDLTLNGALIPKPLEGMTYKVIPGIPPSMLKKGSNEFRSVWATTVKNLTEEKPSESSASAGKIDPADVKIRLFGLPSSALTFQTGPVLGCAGETMFTVSCRVNLPAEVVLEVDGRQYVSESALLHSFKVEGLVADTTYRYSLNVRLPGRKDAIASAGPYSMRTLPGGGNFSFAILGDSRTRSKDWSEVAAAVTAKKPVLSVFVGDMVTDGRKDHEWDEQYFGPAKDFFATIPHYAVIGNHEQDCPLFPQIFPTPGGKNWSQEVGSVLLIGIDGIMDWSEGSDLTRWLEDLLASTQAKFIFLASHYPAWSSGMHGHPNKEGRPRERGSRIAQDVFMPLLKKYNATAMFAGHDHFYERSEPEDGVPVIITGGAGAPVRGKIENSEVQNPYSKVFASQLHYCLLKIDGDVCTMEVLTPEGAVIDTCTWQARQK